MTKSKDFEVYYVDLFNIIYDILDKISLSLPVTSQPPSPALSVGKNPGGGGDLVPTMPVCVCQKVKDMGPFSASSE